MTTQNLPSLFTVPAVIGEFERGIRGGPFSVYEMSKKANPLPLGIIKQSLALDPSSPTWLRWKARPRCHFRREREWKRWNGRYASQVAGTVVNNSKGKQYWAVRVDDTRYLAHRLVYALTYGTDPRSMHVDHINGDGINNTPNNLRLATQSENMRNRGATRKNTSGVKGVSRDNQRQKWRSQIKLNGHTRHLGYFHSLNEASAAYEAAAREHFGAFYREGAAS